MRISFEQIVSDFRGLLNGLNAEELLTYAYRRTVAYDDCRNNNGCNPNPPADLYCVANDGAGTPSGLLGKHIFYFADCLVKGGTVADCNAQWYSEDLKVQICELCY
jgi:hypothetical protein